ncbi:hypothetical protein [Novosphingobium beihaiensis]|uniref:Uncharacterized protein n=1 Tax=Novosphingobium beihaiensis TaxID=2930389 RepID=A0ABT0BNB9_9SPHN|nr:hypothetical protein [Novosphingobium beihaiensis]MCJ2186542.1 hypothetical protein [Novosphingobium beihaiensis]
MTAHPALQACRWREPGGAAAAERILAFLEGIGIAVEPVAPCEAIVLPGLGVCGTTVRIDPEEAIWPGDLLHEAGHIAVAEPARRATMTEVGDDAGEEMAAIAWSAAAAKACDVELDVVFHSGGYRGGSESLSTAFATDNGPGIPLLTWYGMTRSGRMGPEDAPVYPEMGRWLR